MDKLLTQCEKAFLSVKPIVAIDTYEIEIVEEVIGKFKCVELVAADEKTYFKYPGVFKYIKGEKTDEKVNLRRGTDEILSYVKNENPCKLPFVGTEQITDIGGKGKLDEAVIEGIREFIRIYAVSTDKMSYIRNSVIFLYGDVTSLPDDIKSYSKIIDVDYPEMWERCNIVKEKYSERDLIASLRRDDPTFIYTDSEVEFSIKEIAYELAGFSLIQCRDIVDWLINLRKNDEGNYVIFSKEDRQKLIFEQKEQVLKSLGDIMAIYKPSYDENDKKYEKEVKGFDNYYEWIKENEKQIIGDEDYALERGVGGLKGVLICGIPGCGKSEAATILCERWKFNMLKLDIGSLMGEVVGKSEKNMRRALKCAQSMAPVILCIDEIEKGMSGVSSGKDEGSGGVFKRMFAYLLSWMQEYKEDVFVFATANDISNLPPEFFRSGRFDALFCVQLPTADECVEIFLEQMKRAEKLKEDTAKEYDVFAKKIFNFEISEKKDGEEDHLRKTLKAVVEEAGKGGKFLTGADIKKVIQVTLRNANCKVFEEGYSLDKWKGDLLKTVSSCNLSTFGQSNANRDKISASYVRLMREGLLPVSKKTLFTSEFYDIAEDGDKDSAKYVEEGKIFDSEYDEKLYGILVKRINFMAARIEESEAQKITK